MLRASLKSLLAHKLRLVLSGLAVALGVAFVAGSLIFTDTLGKSFRDLFADISADVTVTAETNFANPFDAGAAATVPQSVVERLGAVEGVEVVEPQVSVDGVRAVGADGEMIGTAGPPGLGIDFSTTEGISPLRIVDGREPAGVGEVVIDSGAAEAGELIVGQPLTIVMPSGPPVEVTLVGIADLGEGAGSLGGATLVAWERSAAQELLLSPGQWSAVALRVADGRTDAAVRDRVLDVLPEGYRALTQAEQAEDSASEIEQGLSFINTFLLVFAGVALFVGSFLILNTFSMLVAQRTRELALLRAVGASRRQVTRSVLIEALVLGVVGSTVGLALGAGLALLLEVAFSAFGLDLGDQPLVFGLATVAWAYAVGVGVTVVAAYVPARRASRVPPVAAMREDTTMAPKGLRTRGWFGAAVTLAGAGLLGAGLAGVGGGTAVALVGAGVLAVLVGVTVLSPVLARPVIGTLAATYPRLFGTVGRLGRDNAIRNPRRTATTASALMIGLALVGAMGTLAASTNASIDELIDDTVGADFVVSDAIGSGFSPEVTSTAAAVDGVAAVNAQRFGIVRVEGQDSFVVATDAATLDGALALDYVEGSVDALDGSTVLLDTAAAEAAGVSVGDPVELVFPAGEAALTVGAVFEPNQALAPYVVSLQTWQDVSGSTRDNFVYLSLADAADPAAVGADLEAALADYPNVELRDQTEFKESQRSQVDQFLFLIYALLALSIGIAVLGIVNTLALSVIERTREIGLLRAVGLMRRQLRQMIMLEAVVISVFGALLGLGIGVGFGVALQRALADDGIAVLAVPVTSLLVFLGLSAVVGVLAALWPARRAARIDVLRAVTTE